MKIKMMICSFILVLLMVSAVYATDSDIRQLDKFHDKHFDQFVYEQFDLDRYCGTGLCLKRDHGPGNVLPRG